MKKLLVSLAAVAALGAAAAPAAAQPWSGYGGDYGRAYGGYDARLDTAYVDSLEWKINNARDNGVISWRESRWLLNELREAQPLAWRHQTGQASGWEVRRLEQIVGRIEAAVDRYPGYARRDRDDWRYGGRGWR